MEKVEQWMQKPLTFEGRRVVFKVTVGAIFAMAAMIAVFIVFSSR